MASLGQASFLESRQGRGLLLIIGNHGDLGVGQGWLGALITTSRLVS